LQFTIIDILLDKCIKASEETGIKMIALAGGVSANSGLRKAFNDEAKKRNWSLFIPEVRYTTDNAAMIAVTGYYKYLRKDFTGQDIAPLARMKP
jgi:N6-L-threonylcarbamoyladenine synthase